MTDHDIGDMFLNYQLHEEVHPCMAVDAASPYYSIKMALVAEEVCKGDCFEMGVGCDGKELNAFQCKRVELKLLGTKEYNPCILWISKRRKDEQMACNMFTFINNARVVGPTEELTWQASHMLASKQSYLGIQDAARKAHLCSQMTGAWAGAIVHMLDKLGVCVLTFQEKWTKMRGMLNKSRTVMCEEYPIFSHKELLADWGFLVYITRTYPAMVPYLKGFHLTVEMWQGGGDTEG
jgi:hypothetical protein